MPATFSTSRVVLVFAVASLTAALCSVVPGNAASVVVDGGVVQVLEVEGGDGLLSEPAGNPPTP